MKIDKLFVAALFSAALALQAWTLLEIVALKVQVADLNARVTAHLNAESAAKTASK